MDKKLFLIPAVPSSGTSALAGVLHHLGVYMGTLDSEKAHEKRGYDMFEDMDTWKFASTLNAGEKLSEGKLSRSSFRLRAYINHRLIYDPPGPSGAKIPAVFCVYDPEPKDLDIITLNVQRQFETCLASDRSIMIKAGKYDDIMDDWIKVASFNRLRAGDLGACVAGKMEIFQHHEPVVNVTFDELIANKEEVVPSMVETLGLEPTDEQVKEAIDFLDKDKKHL